MKLLFSPTSELASERTVKHTDLQKYYPNINAALPHAAVEPYIRNATAKYVMKWLGQDFYDMLATHIITGVVNTTLDKLKYQLQTAVANYAVYLAIPSMNGQMGAMGIVQETNENTGPISQWAYKARRWDALSQADTAMDQLLELMISLKDEPELNSWLSSTAYEDWQSVLFKSSTQYRRFANISGHRAYAALLPYIRKAERKLKRILCDQWPTASAASDDAVVIEFQNLCQSYVADLSLLIGIDHTSMTFDGNGWMLASSTDGFDSRLNIKATFADGTEQLKDQLREDLTNTKDDLTTILFGNPEIFTEWATLHAEVESTGKLIVPEDGVGGIMM